MFNRQRVLVGVLIVVVLLIVTGSYSVFVGSRTSPLDTVTLSNGKNIHLGQTTQSLTNQLGFKNTKSKIYYYPEKIDINNPLQATLFADKGRLVAIRVRLNKANVQGGTGIHVGVLSPEVVSKTDKKATPFNEILKDGVARGFSERHGKSTAYYLINPCGLKAGNLDKIVVFALALNGYESLAKEPGAGCGIRS